MFKKLLLIGLLILFITGNALAFTYHAPIEPDNKLLILGETDYITCNSGICNYSFSITNNDSIQHTININPYLNSNIKEGIVLNEINYVPYDVSYESCAEYGQLTDKNGSKYTGCTKSELVTKTLYRKDFVTTLNEAREKMPEQYLTVDTHLFKGEVEVLTTLQRIIGAGQTKYFTIKFKPINETGEFLVTATAEGKREIKASLDPPYGVLTTFEGFEDGDYTTNPAWTVSAGTLTIDAAYKHDDLNGAKMAAATTIDTQINDDTNTIFSHWFYTEGTTGTNKNGRIIYNYVDSIADITTNSIWLEYAIGGVADQVLAGTRTYIGGVDDINQIAVLNVDEWYRAEMVINRTTDTAVFTFYDSTDTLVATESKSIPDIDALRRIILRAEATNGVWIDTFGQLDEYIPNNYLTLDINAPVNGNYSGLMDINFSVTDTNQQIDTGLKLYYSTTEGAQTNLIYSDTNLKDGTGITCLDYDFSTPTSCGYAQWNTALAPDGNYFIDGNLYNVDINTLDSSLEFTIDNYDINANFDINQNTSQAYIDFNDTTTVTGATQNDWNWSIGGLDVSYDQNYVYTDLEEYQDLNVCLETGAVTTDLGLDINSFTCRSHNTGKIYGDTNFYFYDEKTGLPTSATIDFNGTQYTGTSFYLPSQQITNDSNTNVTITFTITKTNYGTRYYTLDMNKYTNINASFLMLADNNGENIDFKFYAPDKTTILANADILVYNTDKDNNLVGKRTTNSNGNVTFFLDVNSGAHTFEITTSTGTRYDYNSISVTVNRPKDEETLASIPDVWSLVISGITAQSFSDISDNLKTIALYTNTINDYIFTIDSNSTSPVYSQRSYYANFPGNDSNYTLQPYLLSGASSIVIYTQDTLLTPITGVSIDIYRVTAEGYTLVEQVETDIGGVAQVALTANQDYYFDVEYNGTNYFTKQRKEITSGTVYFILDVEETTDYNAPGSIQLVFVPGYSLLSTVSYDRTIKMNPSCSNISITSFDVNVTQSDNNGNLLSILYTNTVNSNVCSSQQSFNIDTDLTGSIDTNYPLNVLVTIIGSGQTFYFEKTYTVLDSNTEIFNPIFILSNGVFGDLGCKRTGNPAIDLLVPCSSALIIIAGILLFTAVGISRKVNIDKVGIVMLIELGFFTFIGWFPLGTFALIAFGTVLIIGTSNYNWGA